jgi:hypothetical protein
VLALVAVLSSGCDPAPEPVPLTAADLFGTWCGSDQELLELRPDGGFSMTRISATYLHELLADDGYVDGYRVQQEFGGVAPTVGAGDWELGSADDPSLGLDFDQLGEQEFQYGTGLAVERERTELVLLNYDGDQDSGWTSRFARCAATPSAAVTVPSSPSPAGS